MNGSSLPLLAATLVLSAGCSAVQRQYVARGYDATATGAIKRISIAAWASPADAPLAQVLAQVASDRVKLTRSYLVYAADPVARDWPDLCAERDGVLMLRAVDTAGDGDAVQVQLIASLFDCRSGALVWQAEGRGGGASGDADLENLAKVYVERLGPAAARWAAPVFILLQDMFEGLPEPTLTDDELMEKIELG